jgi:hypothetical protein
MFPIGNGFAFAAYLECAIIGLGLGLVSGILTSVVMKLRIVGTPLAVDAILGAGGAVIITDALWRIGFQYNFVAAVIVAVALPAFHRGLRHRHLGTGQD